MQHNGKKGFFLLYFVYLFPSSEAQSKRISCMIARSSFSKSLFIHYALALFSLIDSVVIAGHGRHFAKTLQWRLGTIHLKCDISTLPHSWLCGAESFFFNALKAICV